jgi:SAM-dependent methyltransferase
LSGPSEKVRYDGVNRKTHWEKVYRDKPVDQVSWFQTEPRISLALIAAAGLGKQDRIIDIGGGASVLVDFLLQQGYRRPAVLDISAAALAHARVRLGARAGEVDWLEADITEFAPAREFALWHDRAVFHFLTQAADRVKYRQALEAALLPRGQVIIATFAKGGPEKCSGLDIVQYDAASLCAELGDGFELLETREELHRTPRAADQKFIYFRLRRRS